MTQQERCKIVAETGVSLSTVIKWDRGIRVHPTIDAQLTRAATDLGLLGSREVGK
jgi:hypothetical protein